MPSLFKPISVLKSYTYDVVELESIISIIVQVYCYIDTAHIGPADFLLHWPDSVRHLNIEFRVVVILVKQLDEQGDGGL